MKDVVYYGLCAMCVLCYTAILFVTVEKDRHRVIAPVTFLVVMLVLVLLFMIGSAVAIGRVEWRS